MFNALRVYNFPAHSPEADLAAQVIRNLSGENIPYMMRTCQRTLIVARNSNGAHSLSGLPSAYLYYEGAQAYRYLLEIICGLQSKVLAENEVVGQFKEAYQEYLKSEKRDKVLMTILEKLFQDTKKIRTEYLREITGQSYAAITRKILITKLPQNTPRPRVIIYGSGMLAVGLIKQLAKRFHVTLCARNNDLMLRLASEYSLETQDWNERENISSFDFIVNTIGSEKCTIFRANFFELVANNHKVFIDLGAPSVIETNLTREQGVWRLADVFSAGAAIDEKKQEKLTAARESINEIVVKRTQVIQEPLYV
jgi:glutamyl-tRNA reductase